MDPATKTQAVLLTTAALAGILGSPVAFATPFDTPHTARFLSSDVTLLPDNYRGDPAAWTFFVVHGFRDQGTSAASLRQADAIRQRLPGANVVIVDWHGPPQPRVQGEPSRLGPLESLWNLYEQYRQAVATTKIVGSEITAWMRQKGIRPSRTVISGHSLGGQVAAFASNECARAEQFQEPIHAILAADPAGPSFELRPPEERLDRTDAHEVIVVHTTEGLGDENAVGTVDIYAQWPESETPNYAWQHSQARERVTASFSRPDMLNTDGTPFGANALGFDFGDIGPRVFRQDGESTTNFASVQGARLSTGSPSNQTL